MNGPGAAASYGDLLMTSLIVLVGVCVAAFVVVKLASRFLATGRARGAHMMDVIARLPLEPRRSLYVVSVADKTLLVGTSEMGLSVLSELDGAEVRSRAVPHQSFGDMVLQALGKRRTTDVPAITPESMRAERGDRVRAVKQEISDPIAAKAESVHVDAVKPAQDVGAKQDDA